VLAPAAPWEKASHVNHNQIAKFILGRKSDITMLVNFIFNFLCAISEVELFVLKGYGIVRGLNE